MWGYNDWVPSNEDSLFCVVVHLRHGLPESGLIGSGDHNPHLACSRIKKEGVHARHLSLIQKELIASVLSLSLCDLRLLLREDQHGPGGGSWRTRADLEVCPTKKTDAATV